MINRVILELIRIIIILFLFGAIFSGAVNLIYDSLGMNVGDTTGGWLVGCAILIIFFVWYRNRLQFSGFYQGEGKVKLPKRFTFFLLSCSLLLLILAPIFR